MSVNAKSLSTMIQKQIFVEENPMDFRIKISRNLFLPILLASFGCGAGNSSELSRSIRAPRKAPVFFIIGGRRSCKPTSDEAQDNPRGAGLHQSLMAMLGRYESETGKQAEYFSACHYNGAQDMAFTSSWDSDVEYEKTEDEVRNEILRKRAQIDAEQAVLIGHSYGGWVAMSLASNLHPSESFGQLYTIDPISKVKCTVLRPFGCRSAPSDINKSARRYIADKSGSWHNYFENQTWHLHSSAIEEADLNGKSNFPHKGIESDPAVWRDILSQVSRRR
jgi:hypothetical protein